MNVRHLYLKRDVDTGKESVGHVTVRENDRDLAVFSTIELPWRDNKKRISCFPPGEYWVRPRVTPARGLHLEVLSVPGRTSILFHVANYVRQLLGCVAVGMSHADIDKDGQLDTVKSTEALKKLMAFIPGKMKLIVEGPSVACK